jgi:hypothetical protein
LFSLPIQKFRFILFKMSSGRYRCSGVCWLSGVVTLPRTFFSGEQSLAVELFGLTRGPERVDRAPPWLLA